MKDLSDNIIFNNNKYNLINKFSTRKNGLINELSTGTVN